MICIRFTPIWALIAWVVGTFFVLWTTDLWAAVKVGRRARRRG